MGRQTRMQRAGGGARRLRRSARALAARSRPGRDGFTLVEIMMVLVILAVGILPVAVIQHQARREVTESDMYTRAVTVAQAQLERVKAQGFGNAVNEAGVDGTVTWATTITNVAFGLDRVDVTVTWQESGDAASLTFADLLSMR